MSQADLIKKAQILERKNRQLQAIADAKASLRSLAHEAVYAQGKTINGIDINNLKAHLDRLIEKYNEIHALQKEIEELEY